MITIRHRQTGEAQLVASLEGVDAADWEELAVAGPSGAAGRLVNGQWQPAPRLRTSAQIYALFTADEKAAIHGSAVPQVQGLISALLFAERVDLDSTFHSQGVALLAGLGLLTPARAAQVLAGVPLETGQ